MLVVWQFTINLPANNLSFILPCYRQQLSDSSAKWHLTWKRVWCRYVSTNFSIRTKLFPLAFFVDVRRTFTETKQWIWAQLRQLVMCFSNIDTSHSGWWKMDNAVIHFPSFNSSSICPDDIVGDRLTPTSSGLRPFYDRNVSLYIDPIFLWIPICSIFFFGDFGAVLGAVKRYRYSFQLKIPLFINL